MRSRIDAKAWRSASSLSSGRLKSASKKSPWSSRRTEMRYVQPFAAPWRLLHDALRYQKRPSPPYENHAELIRIQISFPRRTRSNFGETQRPIQLESCSVPADNSLRLDEDQCLLPSTPEPSQRHPEQSVAG